MKYLVNFKNGSVLATGDEKEVSRLVSLGYTEVDEETYAIEYYRAWEMAVGS